MTNAAKYRIISIDGSKIYRKTHPAGQDTHDFCIRTEKGELNADLFNGYLSRSLETEKILEIPNTYYAQLKHQDYKKRMTDDDPMMPVLVDVYFNHPCRSFNSFPCAQGTRYVKFGYDVNDDEWQDHCVFRTENGKRVLIGIEVAKKKPKKDTKDKQDQQPSPKKKTKKADQSQSEDKYFPYDDVKKNQLPKSMASFICFKDAKYLKKKNDFPYVKEPSNDETHCELKAEKDPSNNESHCELRAENIRRYLYREGFYMDGLHFVRYKRSAGSSRDGHCLFIAEPLYSPMMLWSRCGLKPNISSKDVVSWEAYSALTLSDMKWPLTLSRQSILIVRDRYDTFPRKVIQVSGKGGNEKEPATLEAAETEVKMTNTIWDGEGLLDVSCFDGLAAQYPHTDDPDNHFEKCGMLLLRNRFFKTCAFRTRLQKWFEDNNITNVGQLNGYTEAKNVSDVKLIVTESSIKYFKLKGINQKASNKKFLTCAQAYLNHLFGKDETSVFGIVKTDKPTHHMGGDMVRTSYQMLSTVGLTKEEVHDLYKPSLAYLFNVKSNPTYMRHYLNCFATEMPEYDPDAETENDETYEDTDADLTENANENVNDAFDAGAENCDNDDSDDSGDDDTNEITSDNFTAKAIMELLKYRDDFSRTKYYKDFKDHVRNSFRDRIRRGRILVDGTYATLFGNGPELLYEAIGKDYSEDHYNFLVGNDIYTSKFEDQTDLLCARSPHITMGNLLVSKNTKLDFYDQYFKLPPEIVCVNAIGNDIQHRLNGCDYDSDTMLITDNKILVKAAKRTYCDFLVPYCALDSEKRANIDVATVDIDIADNLVGKIVNLSLLLNAAYWDIRESDPGRAKQIYADVCKLAVLSGMEIDKAKRHYNVNACNELKILTPNPKPNPRFYRFITNNKSKPTDGETKSPMAYIFAECVDTDQATDKATLSLRKMVKFPDQHNPDNDYRYAKNIREAVQAYQKTIDEIRYKQREKKDTGAEDLQRQKQEAFVKCQEAVTQNLKTDGVLLILLDNLDETKSSKISSYHLALFAFVVLEERRRLLNRIVEGGPETLNNLKRDEKKGTVDIYGHKHSIVPVPKCKP